MWPFQKKKKKKAAKKEANVNGQDSNVDPKAETTKIDVLKSDPKQEDTATIERTHQETETEHRKVKDRVFNRSETVQEKLKKLNKKSKSEKPEKEKAEQE